MNDQEIYKLAKKRVRAKKFLFIHFILYSIGIGFLFLLNYFLIYTYRPWFIIPAIFWGIGLLIHFGIVYFPRIVNDESNWEKKELEKEIRRLKDVRDSKFNEMERQNSFDDNLDLKDIEPLQKDWEDQDLV